MQLLTLFNAKYLQTQTKGVIFTTSNKNKETMEKLQKVLFFAIPAMIVIAVIYAACTCSGMYY